MFTFNKLKVENFKKKNWINNTFQAFFVFSVRRLRRSSWKGKCFAEVRKTCFKYVSVESQFILSCTEVTGSSVPNFIYTPRKNLFRQTCVIGVVRYSCSTSLPSMQWITALKQSLLSHKPLSFFGVPFCLAYNCTSQVAFFNLGLCFLFLLHSSVLFNMSLRGAVLCCQTVKIRFLSLICHMKQLYNLRNALIYFLLSCFL